MRFKHIECSIEEGSDGLFAVKVVDTNNGAVWWHTICETKEDAIKAILSLFETQAMIDLQKQLDKVRVKKRENV